jgi:hypothetical protein
VDNLTLSAGGDEFKGTNNNGNKTSGERIDD